MAKLQLGRSTVDTTICLMLTSFVYGLHTAHGLTCYTCSDGLSNCVTSSHAIAAPYIECHRGITECFSKTFEERDGTLTLTSRGCHDGSDVAGCRIVDGQTECVALCDTDHCNDPDTVLSEQDNYVTDKNDSMVSVENTTPTLQMTKTTPIVTSAMLTIAEEIIYCYNCRISTDDEVINEACVYDPQADPVTQNIACNLTQGRGCYTTRKEDAKTLEFREFARSCGVLTHVPPGCSLDAYHRTCTTHCFTHFCNIDDGMPTPKPTTTRRPTTKHHIGSATRTELNPVFILMFTLCLVLS